MRVGGVTDFKRDKRELLRVKEIFCLDRDDVYTTIYVWQISQNCKPKFYDMSITSY